MELLDYSKYSKKIGVYLIECLTNRKVYVGSSSLDLYKRAHQHLSHLKKSKHNNQHLQRSWNKYGIENFKIIVLELCSNKEEVLNREEFYIEKYKSYNPKHGFNIYRFPHTTVGNTWSKEAKEKRKGFKKGRMLSEETKLKISKSHLNKKLSEKTKAKLRALPKNNIGIVMLNLKGEFVKEFRNILEAAKELNTITTPICKVLKGTQKTCKHYRFVYKKDYCNQTFEKIARYNTTRILQYDLQNNFIKEFISVIEAEKSIGVKNANSNIVACCKNRKKSAYGYVWKYKNN